MNKRGIVLYLHTHQPYRIRKYSAFDTTYNHDYFDGSDDNSGFDNERILQKIADKSYRLMNALLEKLLNKYPDFKLSLSITGVFIEQLENWAPDVLDSFKRLVGTGRVEIISETYYHSLAFFYSRDEFERQVEAHRQKIRDVFGVDMKVFRNTELTILLPTEYLCANAEVFCCSDNISLLCSRSTLLLRQNISAL